MNETIVPDPPPTDKQTSVYPCFLGYASLREWAEAVTTRRPVQAMSLVTPGAHGNTPTLDVYYIVCQQRDADGVIHYCRIRIGAVQMLYGSAFGPEEEAKGKRLETVWPFVRDWLLEYGFVVQQAVFATPTNLRLLDAEMPRFIGFDKERLLFYHKTEAELRLMEAGYADATQAG